MIDQHGAAPELMHRRRAAARVEEHRRSTGAGKKS